MLQDRYSETDFINALDHSDWSLLPNYAQADAWRAAAQNDPSYTEKMIASAEEALAEEWPRLNLSLFSEFELIGNRNNYEAKYFRRRTNLGICCAAECLERKGRFISYIIDGFWSLCEESTWVIPAHYRSKFHSAKNSDQYPIVDLFAAETAMVLSSLYQCISPALEPIQKRVEQRINEEINRRVLEPVEAGATYWWLNGTNNWGPWIASNCLMSAATIWPDKERFAKFAHYLSECIDKFIGHYKEDGVCDEGPGYWGKAPGAMLHFLDCLFECSNGQLSIFNQEKIKRMGEYIVHAHLCGNNFVNFADARARMFPNPGVVYRYGERCDSVLMQDFALHIRDLRKKSSEFDDKKRKGRAAGQPEAIVSRLCWLDYKQELGTIQKPLCVYLPDTQVAVLRETQDQDKGFIVAIKGGHNQENHNHNDIGQCIIYHDAKPIFIDVGVGTYSRDTFNPDTRYGIWPIGAQSHNPPVINGIKQCDGEEFKATEFNCSDTEQVTCISMNLKNAYKLDVPGFDLNRECRLERGQNPSVELVDSCSADKAIEQFEVNLVTPYTCTVEEGTVLIEETAVKLEYDAQAIDCQASIKEMDDDLLKDQWGESLTVLSFTCKNPDKHCESRLRITV